MPSKILVVSSNKTHAKKIASSIKGVGRPVDAASTRQLPRSWKNYRLLICEMSEQFSDPTLVLEKLHKDAHVILLAQKLDVAEIAKWMNDPRINHMIHKETSDRYLRVIVEKLARGGIFGMERILPAETEVVYRRLQTFADRCKALDDLAAFTKRKRLRGRLRDNACAIVEELLMNAMYQAPVNADGDRVFEDLTAKARLRRRTPRPVSLRYAVADKRVFVSVRDRFGSLARSTFADYLKRCVTTGAQPERKRLGAGLGLYLVSSLSNELWINVLPGGVTEFVCVLDTKSGQSGARAFSFTAQRPVPTLYDPNRGYSQVAYID